MKRLTLEQIDALRSLPLGDMPNKLAIARTMLRVSQSDVADEAGLSQPAIVDAEAGRGTKLITAQAIATALGAVVDDIFPAREAVTK